MGSVTERSSLPYNHPTLDAFATEVEARYGLPPGMLLATKNAGETTSTLKNGQLNTSPKGAKGVMQFIDSTRAQYPHNVYDPLESIDAAGRYLKDLLVQYKGDPMAALAHYNGGGNNGLAVQAGRQPVSEETVKYLNNIRKYLNNR